MKLTADEIRLFIRLLESDCQPRRWWVPRPPDVERLLSKLDGMLKTERRVAGIQISSHRFEPGWRGQQNRCGYNGCSWTADHHVVDRTTPEVNRAVQ